MQRPLRRLDDLNVFAFISVCTFSRYCLLSFEIWRKQELQGVCRLESQGKSYQNHLKSGKSGKVREFEKNVVSGQGKSGNFFSKYLK